MTFEQPWWLLVSLLALPAGVIGLRWFTAMSRIRAWSSVVARAILLTLIAAALAGASAVRTTERFAVIAVVDISESVKRYSDLAATESGRRLTYPEAVRRWINTAAAAGARGPDDLLGVVVFDGASVAVTLPRPVVVPGSGTTGNGTSAGGSADFSLDYTMADGTNIEQALRFAAALFPPDASRRLLLISDGNETDGDAVDAARRFASAGVGGQGMAIDVLPIAYRVTNEVTVEAVDAPPHAAEGSAVALRVVLNATQETPGTLELFYGDEEFDLNGPEPGTGRRVMLRPGRNVEVIELRLNSGPMIHRFRPVFTADDPAQDRLTLNNTAESFTVTPGQGSVLVIDGVGGAAPDSPGRTLSRTIERAGIKVRTARVEELPADLLSFQEFDLIILQDVAAEEVPRPVQQMMADYVSDLGGGLVMVGGPDSFGAGGWKGTPIEPILPVNIDLPEQLLVPSAAVAIVIDNSGSMSARVGGTMRSQQEIANEGAALAIETLDRTDMVSVIAFNSDFSVVVPMARNSDAAASAAKVRNIGAGGGTNLYPALRRAMLELSSGEAEKASVRHVIVLSDGRSQPPPGGDTFESLVSRMRDRGITVSSISVGDGADDDQLASIAAEGGGKFYKVIDPNMLPRVFVKEIRIVRKPLIREAAFIPIDLRSGSSLIAGMPRPMPPLRGLVLSQKRADPTVTNILATPEGEPVLATWFVGRGRVTGFTSDAHYWAREWIDWPGYASMWTQIVRQTSRPSAERSGELTTEVIGDDLLIRYEATDGSGRPMDLLSVAGILSAPGGERVPVRLSQVGPGAYETRIPAPKRGNYFVVLLPQQGEKRLPSVVGGASRIVGAEFRAMQSNIGLLRQIAEMTGGRVMDPGHPEAAALFERSDIRPVRAASPIWRLLVIWSIVVMLLDVGTRRVAWDRLLSKEVARELRENAAAAVRARSEQAAATVASLRKAARTETSRVESMQAPGPAPAEQDARVMAERSARLRAQMSQASRPRDEEDASLRPPSGDEAGQSAAESTTSGLLAAKRRAAKRYGADPDPQ